MKKETADTTFKTSKKQATADEKSAMAQCKTMSGDAKDQCKKDATAKHDKTMADAKDVHDKANGGLQGDEVTTVRPQRDRCSQRERAPRGALFSSDSKGQ